MTTTPGARTVGRVPAVLERNLHATRFGPSYWVMVAAGLCEPLFYLLTVGIGIGGLIKGRMSYGGRSIAYGHFVAPGLLAISAVAGVLALSVFVFFNRLRYDRAFEVMLTTPVRPADITAAELIWSVARSGLFGALFLIVMIALDDIGPVRALLLLPAVLLVGTAFGAVGMWVTTFIRGWQDFDAVVMAQTAMMLFSGTFFPVTRYPLPLRVIVQVLPLYHAIELLRGLDLGRSGLILAVHAGYLLAMSAGGLLLATRRMDRYLRP